MKWFYSLFMFFFVTIIIVIFVIYDIKNSSGDYSKKLNRIINRKVKYDKLMKISYSNSGDMKGNVENLIIDVDRQVIKYRYSDGFDIPVLVNVYSISDEDINNLGLHYNFNIPNDDDYPLMIMSNVSINPNIVGYIYVFKKDKDMIKDMHTYQYKCYKKLVPIDIVEVHYKDYEKYYKLVGNMKRR